MTPHSPRRPASGAAIRASRLCPAESGEATYRAWPATRLGSPAANFYASTRAAIRPHAADLTAGGQIGRHGEWEAGQFKLLTKFNNMV